MNEAIVEIRDYTIEPAWFERYREWATRLAAPWLRANLPVIDFWLDCGIPAQLGGSAPRPPEHGQANVCWILRWPGKAVRDVEYPKVMRSPQWREIWAQHPNPRAYLQTNVRFMRAADTGG